jgi:hypothetical protein
LVTDQSSQKQRNWEKIRVTIVGNYLYTARGIGGTTRCNISARIATGKNPSSDIRKFLLYADRKIVLH